MAVFAFGVVVAPVLGPTLGGWLTDTYSWRYAFYINIPVGILAVFMIGRFVNDPPYIKNAKVSPFDKLGFGTLMVWTGLLQVILDKGQEDDWFGAMWIRWSTLILFTSFLWWCIHSWRSKTPLVNLHILKNRNFAVGCLLIVLFGMAIYSTITLLPLFYQELLGYTAFSAGLAVFPRGIGSICGMPIIGYLIGKFDPRILLSCGFTTFGITCIYFGNLTLDISPTTLLWPVVITGLALSFVFVPITTVAYGTLRNEQIGNASGLFNLMRNIGGSIGISIAQTLLTRRSIYHQSEMTNSLLPTQIAQAAATYQHALIRFFGPANAPYRAQASIYQELGRQALAWAFVDAFRWLALLCFACVGFVWLLKKVRPAKGAIAAH
jgi:DHA2 family multidrug resistance protein